MTSNSPLTRALCKPSAPAPVQLLMRQSVTPLSQTPFSLATASVLGSKGKVWLLFLAHLAETRPA